MSTSTSIKTYFLPLLLGALMILGGQPAAFAAEMAWQVSKASGDVWLATSGVQKASLTNETELNPGDAISTGKNGRVLLTRGEETILVSPNSVVGIPTEKTEGLQTTIIQQAGSILLEVEKRNVKHFEVETPYLAAVVKGTQFRVSVNRFGTNVDVLRGKVEVADFKTGQFALVLPGQKATVSANGKAGLSLSGAGKLSPIQQGKPRTTNVERVKVPSGGLGAPKATNNGQQVRALGAPGKNTVKAASANGVNRARGIGNGGALRISKPVGAVKLNFQKVTKGLVRGAAPAGQSRGNGPQKTVWNSDGLTPGNGAAKAYGKGNGNGNANGLAKAKASNGNSNGNAGGNGNAYGLANGNGNGKGKGKGKKS